MTRGRRAVVHLVLGLLCSHSSPTAAFNFLKVVDTTTADLPPGRFLQLFGSSPAIGNDGTVAFYGRLEEGNNPGIFAAHVANVANLSLPPYVIATLGWGTPEWDFLDFPVTGSWPAVSNDGHVAFSACINVAGGPGNCPGRGIFFHDPASQFWTATIADTSMPGVSFSGPSPPSLNDDGTLAFSSDISGNGTTVFTALPLTPLTDISGQYSRLSSFPSINGAGHVAFEAGFDVGGGAIVVDGVPKVDTSSPCMGRDGGSFAFDSFGEASINDAGAVAFKANLDGGGRGIYVFEEILGNGVCRELVQETISDFGNIVAMNSSGQVVYTRSGAIFKVRNEPNPAPELVVGTLPNEPSPVTSLGLSSDSIDDAGRIAFSYSLMNGTEGVSVALPTACEDGLDNDGDGETDYPSESGCQSFSSEREDPVCADHVDNDGDGLADYPNDADCTGFTDNNESPFVFDLAENWSEVANPNGPWSYNVGPGFIIDRHVSDLDPGRAYTLGPQPGWNLQNDAVFWARSTGQFRANFDFPAGRVGGYAFVEPPGVTWTSPLSGFAHISCDSWHLVQGGQNAEWRLYRNATLLSTGIIDSSDTSVSSVTPQDCTAGLVKRSHLRNIKILVGSTVNLEMFGDGFVGLDLTIGVRPPQCSDGQDNDHDGLVDSSGDPGCQNNSQRDSEVLPSLGCGLGLELMFVLPPMMWLYQRRRHGGRPSTTGATR